MSTRADLRRPEGTTKVSILHQGPEEIRQNLRTSLLGRVGEQYNHVVELVELVGSVNHTCLTTHNASGEHQILFEVLGRQTDTQVRLPNGSVNLAGLHLGENVNVTAANPNAASTSNHGVIRIPRDEFRMYVPEAYSFQDLLFRLRKKFRRISTVLNRVGWPDVLGDLDDNRDGAGGGC